MADQKYKEAERQAALTRFRVLREETTDPLAAGMIDDIIHELETDEGVKPSAPEKPHN